VAKIGCLTVGCCGGIPVNEISASSLRRHPTALYELAGFVLLDAALRGRSDAWVAPVFGFGFGAIRLVVEPLRATPPLGEPAIPALLLAGAWLVASLLLTGCLLRGEETPSRDTGSSAPLGTSAGP
jgi:prolipoprotein diacylglyceryltransferase